MKVTLLIADGLQIAALGAYGNDWIPTPNLDRFAADSVVFDQHFADVPLADPWHARHGFPPAGHPVPTPVPAQLQRIDLTSLLPPWDVSDELLGEVFEDWEFDGDPLPWLEPEPGWLAPEDDEALDRLQRTYAAVVRQFDEELGQALESLSPEDLVVITNGRGQNLGEHGLIGDLHPWLHEELVHLPLLIRLPNAEQAGRRVFHLTSSVDLAPTIQDALGLPVPEDWHGHSLLPLCRGAGPIRPYVCMGRQIKGIAEYALQTTDGKAIVPANDPARRPMYFIKPDDRWEVNDLRQSNLDYAEALEHTLQRFVEASAKPGKLEVPPLPELED